MEQEEIREGGVDVHIVFPSDSSWPIGVFSDQKVAEAIVEDMGTDLTWTCSWRLNEGLASFLSGSKIWEVDFHPSGLVESELAQLAWCPDEGVYFPVEVDEDSKKSQIIRVRVWAKNQLESLELAVGLYERYQQGLKKRTA